MRIQVRLLLLLLLTAFSLCVNAVVGKAEAPNFGLTDIYGTRFSLFDYRGKVVLIDFFRVQPSCPPCLREIPHLKSIYNKYSEDELIIMSISVSASDTNEILQDFAQGQSMEWIVALGTNQIATDYDIQYVPTLFIIDKDGYIVYEPLIGERPASELISKIDPLLLEVENGDADSDSNGDSGRVGPGISIELMGIIGVVVVSLLVIGIVVAGRLFQWSKPAKKRGKHKH